MSPQHAQHRKTPEIQNTYTRTTTPHPPKERTQLKNTYTLYNGDITATTSHTHIQQSLLVYSISYKTTQPRATPKIFAPHQHVGMAAMDESLHSIVESDNDAPTHTHTYTQPHIRLPNALAK